MVLTELSDGRPDVHHINSIGKQPERRIWDSTSLRDRGNQLRWARGSVRKSAIVEHDVAKVGHQKKLTYQIGQCRNGETTDARTGHGGPHLQSRHIHTNVCTCMCVCVHVLGGLKQAEQPA